MKPAQIRRSFVRKLLAGSIVFVFLTVHGFAQNISGLITDEQGNPVSFANVFVRELSTGTSTDDKGYYFLTIDPGVYNLVYSSIGYHTKTIRVIITDKPLTQHMVLPASTAELDEIVVKASRKDPAYEIIQQVIANREKYLSQVKSARTNVYLRATEVTDTKARKSRPDPEASPELSTPGPPADPFAAAKTKQDERLQNINLVEMQLTLNFQYPGQYKEERTGFKTYGSNEGLFIPLFSESDFNFYHNLVNLKGISEVPLISPVSKLAVLSYKYKLDEVLQEGKQLVYKIRVIPRKTGDATAKGHLYINDSTWNINRLELTLEKGALKFYDAFTIRQNYQQLAGDVWIPARQEFLYHTRGPYGLGVY
jgi:hypothetical protein